MASTSTFLGLTVPVATDAFSTSVLASNWSTIDGSPGTFVGTNSQVVAKAATWGSSQAGLVAYDTTKSITWRWTGSSLVRNSGKGYLNTASGPLTTTVNFSSGYTASSTTPTSMVVASTTGWPSSGNLQVALSGGGTAVYSYGGKTSTSFTSMVWTSGTGTIPNGALVSQVQKFSNVVASPITLQTMTFTVPVSPRPIKVEAHVPYKINVSGGSAVNLTLSLTDSSSVAFGSLAQAQFDNSFKGGLTLMSVGTPTHTGTATASVTAYIDNAVNSATLFSGITLLATEL